MYKSLTPLGLVICHHGLPCSLTSSRQAKAYGTEKLTLQELILKGPLTATIPGDEAICSNP